MLVGIVLGVFLIGGVISLFTSNQQSFKVGASLARLQESSRFAFEQMNREIRDAGTNPCGVRVVNSIVRTPSLTIPWWGDWDAGTVRGFDGTEVITAAASSVNNRVSGTDAIIVMRTMNDDGQLRPIVNHDPVPAITQFTFSGSGRYSKQDLGFVCDNSSGAIFEVTTPNAPPATVISYDATPPSSNCTSSLGWGVGVDCNANAVAKTFAPGSLITKFDPAIWYIGTTASGGTALFRESMHKSTSPDVITTERREYAPDVSDMQITYLMRTKNADPTIAPTLAANWVDASVINAQAGAWGATNLNEAVAVRIALTFRTKEAVGTDGSNAAVIQRQSISVVSLRNREIVR